MTKKVHGRHGARWVALQALYAWQFGGSLRQIESDLMEGTFQFEKEQAPTISFDKAYLQELLLAIGNQFAELDALILPHLDRPLPEVHPIEHGILWVAIYEIQNRLEIPYKVIINEAILLAKQFGAQDSHKFINGVLDKAAKTLRVKELEV